MYEVLCDLENRLITAKDMAEMASSDATVALIEDLLPRVQAALAVAEAS
jgi:hypothetical protein